MTSQNTAPIPQWYDIDPLDPQRYLLPLEHNFIMKKSITHSFFYMTEVPDLKRLQEAYMKVLEAYPCLVSEVEMQSNGCLRYVPKEPHSPDFEQLYKDAPTVNNNDELIEFGLNMLKDAKPLECVPIMPCIVKIDAEKSKECPVMRGEYKIVFYVSCNHALADGTSIMKLPGLINLLYNDPSYVIPIKEPQRVPMFIGMLLSDDCKDMDLSKASFGPGAAYNGYLNSSAEHPPALGDRGTIFVSARLAPGTITRFPFPCRLTSCFTGMHAFMVLSLLLHQHPEADAQHVALGQARLVDMSYYKNPFKDSLIDLCGMRVTSTVSVFDGPRTGFGVHQFARIVENNVKLGMTKEHEYAYHLNQLGLPRLTADSTRLPMGRHRASNVGRINVPEGIIKAWCGMGFIGDEFGTIHVCPSGMSDGSTIILLDADKACFTREFLKYYLEVYIKLWGIAVKEDITYDMFVKMPEYKKLCELLDVKKPSWM